MWRRRRVHGAWRSERLRFSYDGSGAVFTISRDAGAYLPVTTTRPRFGLLAQAERLAARLGHGLLARLYPEDRRPRAGLYARRGRCGRIRRRPVSAPALRRRA